MSYNRRTLSPDSPYALFAAILMFASAAIRSAFYIITGFPVASPWTLFVHYLLPVACCAIMGIMLLSRKNSLIPTIIPMLLGVAFFALKTLDFPDNWIFSKTVHCVFCCILYAVFGLVYILTVTGVLNTRAVMMLLCGLPLIFHIFVEDIFISPPSGIVEFLPELSVILIMLSLLIVTFGMRRGRLY